jgi:hypothetical protein
LSDNQEFASVSLLKPEARKQSQLSLSPANRNSSRKQSASSFNESYSEKEMPSGSVMVGFQASMMSLQRYALLASAAKGLASGIDSASAASSKTR